MIPVLATTTNIVQLTPAPSFSFDGPSPVLQNLHFWLNPRVGHTKDGSDLVSSWEDSSYHGDDALQGNINKRPKWYVSGSGQNPSFINQSFIEFDGADDVLSAVLTKRITGSAHTFGIVYSELLPNDTFDGLYSEFAGGVDFQGPAQFVITTTGSFATQRFEHNSIITPLTGMTQGTAHILIGTFSGEVVKLYVDQATPAQAEFSSSTDFNVGTIILAGRAGTPGKCQFSEVVVYGKELNNSERTDLFNYLVASISGTL
ncbi:hypothetical protein LCGC14_0718140 [marine sediment metagenome]|uniref:LamG-like jellyroll fold domain-containing protein n=1 Tax=marine sediment metagenome TaxID=412755 RepID=A0A0F9QY97_9ZZZZ